MIEFDRYEVWATPELGAERSLIFITHDLAHAKRIGDNAARQNAPIRRHYGVAIDYIALTTHGRIETSWVRSRSAQTLGGVKIAEGEWIALGGRNDG
jgi:hypothetical protein